MKISQIAVLLVAAVAAFRAPAARGLETDNMKLRAVTDASLCSVPDERDNRTGGVGRFKLKYLEEMAVIGFDLGPLAGRRVVSAWLYCHSDPESARAELARLKIPETFEIPLRKIGVSTVSSRWDQGTVTFNEAARGKPWAWRGSRLWDVIFGCGNSVHSHAEIEKLGDYWWRVEIDPQLLNLLAAGGGHGLCVMEESMAPWEYAPNNFIHSSEAGEFAPYLVLETEPAPSAPAALAGLSITPAAQAASLESGAVRLSLSAPEDALAYRITVDGAPLEPWMVDRPAEPGAKQTLTITDLPADSELEFYIAAVGYGGAVSAPVSARARTSGALDTPAVPPVPARPSASQTEPAAGGPMRARLYPEIVKVDPLTGKFLSQDGSLSPDGTGSAEGARMSLTAARGEIPAFQLAIEAVSGPLDDVRVEVGPLRSADAEIPPSGIAVYRQWYVKPKDDGPWQPELAVPLDAPLRVPDDLNGVPGQKCQSLWVDVVIPKETPPGRYEGTVTVSAKGVPEAVLPLSIEVLDVVIPDELAFWGELNGYGAPGGAGSDYYYAAHRIAHFNRCAINIVPYGQSRKADETYRPVIEGTGGRTRVVDWSRFDQVHGPLLDGSAFAGLPRDSAPVRVFYLPVYENWPAPFLDNYAVKMAVSEEGLNLHHLTAPPIEEAVSEDFTAAWRAVVPEFARHFREKGWGRTMFQFYLNNKWHMSKTMFWTLDEPAIREDYLALKWFYGLFRESLGADAGVDIVIRGDISRPQWQFDDFNGLIDIEYVNSGVVDMVRSTRIANARAGSKFVVYGTANDPSRSNFEMVQWCFNAYTAGGLGVLPWNSFETKDVYTRGLATGLIVPGGPVGFDGPVASLRVLALRRAVENVELLRMLAARKGWTLDQTAVFVNRFVPLGAEFVQRFPDEAAAGSYADASASRLADMRAAIFEALNAE